MKKLLAYYSRTGHTERLALHLADELRTRGHTAVIERIEVMKPKSRWNLVIRQIYQDPLVALSVWSSSLRRWWLARYPQPRAGPGADLAAHLAGSEQGLFRLDQITLTDQIHGLGQ